MDKEQQELEEKIFGDGKTPPKVKEKEEEEGVSQVSVMYSMRDMGLIDFDDLEEGEEYDETEAQRMIQDAYDETIMQTVEETMKNLPPLVKELTLFTIQGGNPDDFIKRYNRGEGKLSTDLDISKEANQILVMKDFLKSEDFDDEDIEAQIENLKDTGRLAAMAEKRFGRWKTNVETERRQLVEQQKQVIEAQKQKERQFRDNLYQTISETEEIGGIKLSRNDKRDLADYMVTRTVPTQNGQISPFYRDLSAVLSNVKAHTQLAKLLRERNKDGTFNFSTIEKGAETRVTKNIKNNLERKGSPNLRGAGGKSSGEINLVDWLSQ